MGSRSGSPDVTNLKALAGLFDTSIDYLLDDDEYESGAEQVMKEPIDLSKYPRVKWNRLGEDEVVREYYPNAELIVEYV